MKNWRVWIVFEKLATANGSYHMEKKMYVVYVKAFSLSTARQKGIEKFVDKFAKNYNVRINSIEVDETKVKYIKEVVQE